MRHLALALIMLLYAAVPAHAQVSVGVGIRTHAVLLKRIQTRRHKIETGTTVAAQQGELPARYDAGAVTPKDLAA